MERFPVPPELKVEFYERRRNTTNFERLELAIELIPGKDGIGAVVRNFIDAISLHDVAVKNVEDKWLEVEGLRHDFNRKNRLYRNFDSAWNTMNQNPVSERGTQPNPSLTLTLNSQLSQ